jgi:hypothetical protein
VRDFAGKQCEHGFCLDHEPQFETVDTQEIADPGFSGIMTYWLMHHCGRAMVRLRIVETRRCKVCGRMTTEGTKEHLAACFCCGYREHVRFWWSKS